MSENNLVCANGDNLFQDFSPEDESTIADNLFQGLDESTGLNLLPLESLKDIVGGHQAPGPNAPWHQHSGGRYHR